MKILHTSDWHLGKHLNNFSRHPEQVEVLTEIAEITDQENVDVVIIAGDLFDNYNPPAESAELFYKILKQLTNNAKRAVIAIAGNHDSPDRIEAPDPLARACGIIFAGYPNSIISPFELDSGLKIIQSEEGFISVKLPGNPEPLRILLTPYANEYRLKKFLGTENQEEVLRNVLQEKWTQLADKYCDDKGVNILLAHLMFIQNGDMLPEEPEDEKPILNIGGAQAIFTENIPPQIQYTALGHLHRKQKTGTGPALVYYPGSPIAYSFSEAGQKKYVLIADILPNQQAVVHEIELKKGKKLLRKRAESVEEAIQWLRDNQEQLIELTIVSETYLTSEERNMLFATHSGIISLIPELKTNANEAGSKSHTIDLTKSIEELFGEYFKSSKGQLPNDNIMNLLREVLSEEERI